MQGLGAGISWRSAGSRMKEIHGRKEEKMRRKAIDKKSGQPNLDPDGFGGAPHKTPVYDIRAEFKL
jgi:hypothetical protein